MITLTKIREATAEFIKVLRFGKNDVQTAEQVAPFGIDSKPIKNITGVHATTANIDNPVILGYLYTSEITAEGETRIFASDGEKDVFYILLKKDGTCEFNGTGDYFVKFNEMKTQFDKLTKKVNSLITIFNAHTHAGVTTGPGISGVTATLETATDAKIDGAKSDGIITK